MPYFWNASEQKGRREWSNGAGLGSLAGGMEGGPSLF